MSNTQYAFLQKSNVPTREKLQESIDRLGYDLKLDPEFIPFEDDGFSPCVLEGNPGAGFEVFYEPTSSVVGDDDEFRSIAGGNDYCISMTWRGSMKDCAAAMIVSCALATDFGAVISYEGEEPETMDSLKDGVLVVLAEAKKER